MILSHEVLVLVLVQASVLRMDSLKAKVCVFNGGGLDPIEYLILDATTQETSGNPRDVKYT